MDREKLFWTPHVWPFKNHWNGQKSCFLIRRVLKKAFFIWPPPGLLFSQNKSHCQTFKMDIHFLTPIFDHLKALERSEIMFSTQKSVKVFFAIHQGALSLFCLYMFSPSFLFLFKLADRLSVDMCHYQVAQLGPDRC